MRSWTVSSPSLRSERPDGLVLQSANPAGSILQSDLPAKITPAVFNEAESRLTQPGRFCSPTF